MVSELYQTFRCVRIYLAAKFILLYEVVTFGSFIVKECNAFYRFQLHDTEHIHNLQLNETGLGSDMCPRVHDDLTFGQRPRQRSE